MARGRMINQKITSDIDFNEMSIDAQFMFMRAIPFLDRDGLLTGHPALLWSKIAPLLPQYSTAMTAITDEWVSAGFVTKYTDGKTPVLFFRGFHKNQALTHYDREAASEFAPPPNYHRTPKGIRADDSGQAPDNVSEEKNSKESSGGTLPVEVRTNSGLTPDQIPMKGKEIKVKETTTTTAPNIDPEPKPEQPSGSSGGGLPEKRNRRGDEEFARLCLKLEMEGFGTLTDLLAEQINALLNEHPVDWISDAMAVAVGANKRQINYVRGILVRWRADGRNAPGQPSANVQGKQLLTLKRWCLNRYNIDNPKLVADVPEERIYAEYEHYRQQQAH